MTSPTGRRTLLPLALSFLTVGLSAAMSGPFLALFLADGLRADGVHVALFLAGAPVAAMVVSTLLGRVSDRSPSRRWFMVGTALAGSAATGLTAVVRDYRVLLGVTVTLAASAGALLPQILAYARESLPGGGRVALTLSSLRSLFSVAWVAGPPLAAVLLHVGGFALVYAGSCVMYAVTALTALVALRSPRPPAPEPGLPGEPHGAGDRPASRAQLWAAVAVMALVRCAGSLAVQGLPLFTTQVLHGPVTDAGLLLGLCAALEIPLMIGFGALATRVPLRRLLAVGIGCGLVHTAVVATSTALWQLVAVQVVNAAGVAATAGLGITYLQDLLPGRAGRASTLYSNTFATGSALAGPVLGAAQGLGYRSPYVVGAVLSAAALVLLLLVRPHSGTVAGYREDAGSGAGSTDGTVGEPWAAPRT